MYWDKVRVDMVYGLCPRESLLIALWGGVMFLVVTWGVVSFSVLSV